MTPPASRPAALVSGVRRPADQPLTVVLHVGAFKTGTSYVQNMLWQERAALAARGVLFPGRRSWSEQVLGVRDRIGWKANKKRQRGAWDRLVKDVHAWQGSHVLVSMEFLSLAAPRRARLAVQDLAPARVEVVLTARDLARVVPAAFQERIKNGESYTWDEFAASLRGDRTEGAGKLFWRQQDLPQVAATWAAAAGDEHLTVVTVGQRGAPQTQLLERIGTAGGLDLTGLDATPTWDNTSLGAVETEAIRRLNKASGRQLNARGWGGLVRDVITEGFGASSRSVRLTEDDLAWVRPLQSDLVARLGDGGWRVVGDLAELDPPAPAAADRGPGDVGDDEVAEALTWLSASFANRLVAGSGHHPQGKVPDSDDDDTDGDDD